MEREIEAKPSFGSASSTRIRLSHGGALILEEAGFRLIAPRGLKRSPLRAWSSVNHVYATDRLLLIGTESGLVSVQGRDFLGPEPAGSNQATGPTEARRQLLEYMEADDGRESRRAALDEVEALGEADGPAWIVWAIVATCLLGMVFQLLDPAFERIGAFLPDLFLRGETWRAVTAHFLHDLGRVPVMLQPLLPGLTIFPAHLVMNVAGLLILGHLVERPQGGIRTALILAAGSAGTILGIMIADHFEVIGASGLVAAMTGSILAMELHYSRWLPSFWRLPRWPLIAVLVLQFLVLDPLFSNYLAGGAHLGGFVGGYVATWTLGRPVGNREPASRAQHLGAYCAAAFVLIGFLGAMPLVRGEMPALERHGARLLNTPKSAAYYRHDNETAWLIATEGGASARGIGLAVALADRAVANTARLHPDFLDTLAEALFQSGNTLAAILTIDEAIQLQPWEPYFIEQRKRFTGERPAGDRPPAPGLDRYEVMEPEEAAPTPLPTPLLNPVAPRVTT